VLDLQRRHVASTELHGRAVLAAAQQLRLDLLSLCELHGRAVLAAAQQLRLDLARCPTRAAGLGEEGPTPRPRMAEVV
jgi:hypothetical protein